MAIRALCSVEDCDKPTRTRGFCATHYLRLWRTGETGGEIVGRGEPFAWLMAHINHVGEECLMWPFQRNNVGYATISKRGRKTSAARMMCVLAHGEPETSEIDTAHSCGRGHLGCVNPSHVRWASRSENMKDAIGHGTTTKGERNAQAALTEADVRAIRLMAGVPYKQIARQFGISPSAVGLIMRRERWGWLVS